MHRFGLLVVAAVVTVAGCAGDSDDDSESGDPDGPTASTTIEPATSVPDSSVPETSVPETSVPETSVPSSAPATSAPRTSAPATSAPATSVAPVDYDFSEVDALVARSLERSGLNGASLIVVERDAGIVHERYWGDFDADRISFIASSSKMVTAGVLMYLDDQGSLDVDAPIADAVDWGSGNPDITPAQLVSNSSGLVGLLPNPAYGPYVCQFLVPGSLEECAATIFTTPDDDGEIVAPDTEFRYGGGQWQVAGGLAEAVSGMSWTELIDAIYVEPCGLTTFGYNNQFTQFDTETFGYPHEFDGDPTSLAPTANPNMEAGAYTNAVDYARLLLMHLRDGRCGDAQVLSPEAVAALHADRIGAAYDGSTPLGSGYGMGWWVDRATGIISDAGAYGSYPWLDVAAGYGAVLIIESDGGSGETLGGALVGPIIAALQG